MGIIDFGPHSMLHVAKSGQSMTISHVQNLRCSIPYQKRCVRMKISNEIGKNAKTSSYTCNILNFHTFCHVNMFLIEWKLSSTMDCETRIVEQNKMPYLELLMHI